MKMPFIPKAAKNQQGFTETVKRRGGFFFFSFSRRDGEFKGMEEQVKKKKKKEQVRQPPNILPPSNSSGQRSFSPFPHPSQPVSVWGGWQDQEKKGIV